MKRAVLGAGARERDSRASGGAGEIVAIEGEEEGIVFGAVHRSGLSELGDGGCEFRVFGGGFGGGESFDGGFPPLAEGADAGGRTVGMGHDAAAGHVEE